MQVPLTTGRAVKWGLARQGHEVVTRLGVDEKAIAKPHHYLTIVADLNDLECSTCLPGR